MNSFVKNVHSLSSHIKMETQKSIIFYFYANQLIQQNNKMARNIDAALFHSLNFSKTKQTHKFSTSERFPKTTKSPCLKYSYDLNASSAFFSSSSKKNQHFGNQRRFSELEKQLRKQSCSPSPCTYKISDELNLTKSLVRHNETLDISTFGNQKRMVLKVNDAPGPGKYEANSYNPEVKLSYTMRSRVNKNEHWNRVGPGQYNLNSSFSTKNSSVLGQSNANKFGKQKRFMVIDKQCPAPNAYQKSRLMTEPVSKYYQPQKYSFGRDNKLKRIKTDTPGPGAYQKFSEFYEGEFYTSSAR